MFSLFGILFSNTSSSAGSLVSEERVKAAYLYQFSSFVKWPKTSAHSDGNFRICVVGDAAVVKALSPIQNRKKKQVLIKIVDIKSLDELRGCQIAYIGSTRIDLLSEIKSNLKDMPVLTVSDITGYAENHGIIGFLLKDGKIKIEINIDRAKGADLAISAKLLEVSLRVFKSERTRAR